MKNVRILDCTLRDGGRIIDCKFPDADIEEISNRLAEAKIDIVELGFLRDWRKLKYEGNSTFFTDVDQMVPYTRNRKKGTMYLAFVDFGMFDFDTLKPYDGNSIDGIRVGFTRKDYLNSEQEVIRCLNIVKERGYKLFVQGVNSLGYTDKELLEIIDLVNSVKPYGFGIVDTYGAMYVDDVRRIYTLVDHNLDDEICIDFHSHNNFQLSFSFAQEIISMSHGKRNIIIDATLNGMGKAAGNLNTELIVDFLIRKMGYHYDLDMIFDIIDDYMYQIKQEKSWGYSIPSMMAGIYKSHPNNIIFLTEKFRLATKDIKYILSMIDPALRQRYDYDNIRALYEKYNHTKVDDRESVEKLAAMLKDRKVLLLLPGSTIDTYADTIEQYIAENNPFIISVNFVTKFGDKANRLAFFGSEKRYLRAAGREQECNVASVSNIDGYADTDLIFNYESLIARENEDFENSMIMLLNLLRRIEVENFAIAGFDGYQKGEPNYSKDVIREDDRFKHRYDEITLNMRKMLKAYKEKMIKPEVCFLTPSVYADIFKTE
ncbi:MAG: hypothetical protein IKI01_09495 [Lachnospiraceae bacterium]|nr:hypothetical protein [Lachnospiraceae bacterium]